MSAMSDTEARIADLETEVTRLKTLLDRDQTGLVAALNGVRQECSASSWIAEGRGSYALDDDKYREETGWFVRRVLGIADEALRRSGFIAHAAFHPNSAPVQTFAELEAENAELRRKLEAARLLLKRD